WVSSAVEYTMSCSRSVLVSATSHLLATALRSTSGRRLITAAIASTCTSGMPAAIRFLTVECVELHRRDNRRFGPGGRFGHAFGYPRAPGRDRQGSSR